MMTIAGHIAMTDDDLRAVVDIQFISRLIYLLLLFFLFLVVCCCITPQSQSMTIQIADKNHFKEKILMKKPTAEVLN